MTALPPPPPPPVTETAEGWWFLDEHGERCGPFSSKFDVLYSRSVHFDNLRLVPGQPPLPPLRQIGSGWWFRNESGGLRGPFEEKYDALRGLEIYLDCVVQKKDVLSFSNVRYRFLSNFWQVKVDFCGLTYPSTEHAFQAAKTLDLVERERIRCAYSSAEAKQLGKQVRLRADWEGIKISVMRDFFQQKFYTDPLEQWLLQTGDVQLVEGNTWGDAFWGVTHGGTGVGRNELGKLLMSIRAELQSEGGT